MGLRFTHTWEWEREIIRPSQGKPGVAVLQRARNPRRETEKGSVRQGGGDPQAKRRPGRCRPGPPRTHRGPVLPGSGSGSFVSSKGELGQPCAAFQVGERILVDGFSESGEDDNVLICASWKENNYIMKVLFLIVRRERKHSSSLSLRKMVFLMERIVVKEQ